MHISNYQYQQPITIENFLTISNQSYLSPEVIFINKPYKIENNIYYKIFINLNFNPNIVNKDELYKIKNLEGLDFRLFDSKSLKEIRPVNPIISSLEINNNLNNRLNLIEYNIPKSYIVEEETNLMFGIEHYENQVKFKAKGQIKLYSQNINKLDYEQTLVSYFRNYDFVNHEPDWSSHPILKAKTVIKRERLFVNKEFDYLAKLDLKFEEANYDELNNNLKIREAISQVKNESVSPHYYVETINFGNALDYKTFYQGNISGIIEKNNSNYLLKTNNILQLNHQSKILDITKISDKPQIFKFNSFSWANDQSLQIHISSFGKPIMFESFLSTFDQTLDFNQNDGFNFLPTASFSYSFNISFWTVLEITNEKDFGALIKKYEI